MEELGRHPPPPTACCLKRDEPDPLTNGRQVGVGGTHCSHVIVVVWANPPLCIELMHHHIVLYQNSLCNVNIALHLVFIVLIHTLLLSAPAAIIHR